MGHSHTDFRGKSIHSKDYKIAMDMNALLLVVMPIGVASAFAYWVLDRTLPEFGKLLRRPLMFFIAAFFGFFIWYFATLWYVNKYGT